jgi:chemotaxis protein CheD
MSQVVIGIGDCRVSTTPDDVLVTYALGSCIGIAVHDPMIPVGGLLHFMLPDSAIDPTRSADTPFKFADTGIPLLLDRMAGLGAQKRRLVVRIAGGAQMMDPAGVFDIGKRNYQALRRILWKSGLLVHAEVIGGTTSRSIRLQVGSGRLWLREAAGAEQEFPVPGAAMKGESRWHTAS